VPWKARLLTNCVLAAAGYYVINGSIGNATLCTSFSVLTCVVLVAANWFPYEGDREMLGKIISHFRPKAAVA
jgi:hypothetical protein